MTVLTVTRRSVIQGALYAGAALCAASAGAASAAGVVSAAGSAGAPGATKERPGPAASLIVFDGRFPQSHAFAFGQAGRLLDVALEPANLWRGLRFAAADRVIGATRWSDFVQVRGCLQEFGLRVRVARRSGELFQWEMSRSVAG